MKPDWKDAPEWANWLVMDFCGNWWWHEMEPRYNGKDWASDGDMILAAEGLVTWGSLEARP